MTLTDGVLRSLNERVEWMFLFVSIEMKLFLFASLFRWINCTRELLLSKMRRNAQKKKEMYLCIVNDQRRFARTPYGIQIYSDRVV